MSSWFHSAPANQPATGAFSGPGGGSPDYSRQVDTSWMNPEQRFSWQQLQQQPVNLGTDAAQRAFIGAMTESGTVPLSYRMEHELAKDQLALTKSLYGDYGDYMRATGALPKAMAGWYDTGGPTGMVEALGGAFGEGGIFGAGGFGFGNPVQIAGTGAPDPLLDPGSSASDVRLKKDIQKVGELTSGLNIYTWEWNDKAHEIGVADSPTYGVVAQEAAKLYPDAVTEGDDGYLRVDYSVGGLGELWN